jgi:hypothetical protein
MNFEETPAREVIDYVYTKPYMKEKCNATKNNTAYELFKVVVKKRKLPKSPEGIDLVDYYYYITDHCVFLEENITKEKLNMHVNNWCSDTFICRRYDELCLVKSTYGTNNPEGIIPFGEHENMNDLFIFYERSKLNVKTLEGAIKEILFIKFMDEY